MGLPAVAGAGEGTYAPLRELPKVSPTPKYPLTQSWHPVAHPGVQRKGSGSHINSSVCTDVVQERCSVQHADARVANQ